MGQIESEKSKMNKNFDECNCTKDMVHCSPCCCECPTYGLIIKTIDWDIHKVECDKEMGKLNEDEKQILKYFGF